jgi:aminoglycoside phosphotransferase (APT) family kinase protein
VSIPGLDLERLRPWLPDGGGVLSAIAIAGGKSNLTYEVTNGAQSWIVRRPPPGQLLATAHDMSREYRVMQALARTAVPVPRMFAICADESVLGAPFYVMEKVNGRPFRYVDDIAPLGRERTRAISETLVDTLAALHAVDPVATGLQDLGRPDEFLLRQANRWKKQLDSSGTRDLPAADELYRRLVAHVPAQAPTGIVHGDYRLDNVLIDKTDTLAAVIDWEMSTIGDPLTDLALMVVYGRLGEIATQRQVPDVASAPGYLDEQEIIERYALHTSRDLSHFGFYIALASFKLVAILEGIRSRQRSGQTLGSGLLSVDELIQPLVDGGLDAHLAG